MKTAIKEHNEKVGIDDNIWHYNRPVMSFLIDHRSYLKKKQPKRLCISKYYFEYPTCIPAQSKGEGWSFAPNTQIETNSLEIEKKLYESKIDFYLKYYEGKYIALQNQEVLDSDTEFSKIAERVYSRYGYRPIFMPLVVKEEPRLRLRSPRFK